MKGAVREQRGGAAILVAFMLLALMAGASFGTSRNLVRELAMCADQAQGAKAASAAEAGLAWFLDWADGDPDGFRSVLACAEADPGEERAIPAPAGLPLEEADAALRQGFELRIRSLGALPPAAADRPGPAGRLWLVRCAGRSALRGRGPEGFTQIRELLVASPPAGAPGSIRILAWRAGSGAGPP